MFKAGLRAARFEARLLPIGFAGGEVPQIPANIMLVKNVSAIGFWWGDYLENVITSYSIHYTKLYEANVVTLGILKKRGYTVSFREFMGIGIPFTVAAVTAACAFVWWIWGA